MQKTKRVTTNPTLLKLKGTPFRKAAELKLVEDKILREEWQNIERARVRRELLMKKENRIILAPFLNGFRAKFVGANVATDHMVRVFLTEEDAVQVEINDELRGNDVPGAMESLVKSLVEGLMGGYLTALGLKLDTPFKLQSQREPESSD